MIYLDLHSAMILACLAFWAGTWAQRRWPDAVTARALRRYYQKS